MVEFNTEKQEQDLNYQKDIKSFFLPKEIKRFIIADMLNILIDHETEDSLTDFDSSVELKNGFKIEWKNGKRMSNGKLPLEIYLDYKTQFPGCLAEAKADYIIFVKKYPEKKHFYDIYVCDYPALVNWWWGDGISGVAHKLAKYQNFNKPTYNANKKVTWISSFYPFIPDKIQKHILINKRLEADLSLLFKVEDKKLVNYF